jgi:RNA polymerase sigma factor (sigma-70 family)
MMEAVAAIPPFETFYAAHADEVLGFLRKRAGRDRADDLFQETFLRALRAYDRLAHGEHLRAWVFTIAARVVVDAHRRAGAPAEELPELVHEDGTTVLDELAPLTDGLPPKERAAVVLRYGFDLDYDQIAAALGSSPDAARQATSSGVRRLRREGSTG